MRSIFFLFIFLLTAGAVFATSIGNVPTLEERDLTIRPGMHKEYTFSVGGAQLIDITLLVPPELKEYVTLKDPSPGTGPRTVNVVIDFPSNVQVPPGVYSISFSANERGQSTAQISAFVSVSFGILLRSYSSDPFLEIADVMFTPVPENSPTNFSVAVISRTLKTIPEAKATVTIINESGAPLVTAHATTRNIPSGERAEMRSTIDVSHLVGGIYRSNVIVEYDGKVAQYNKSILRIGTLTIDVTDYTKTLTFNQTNKFQVWLESNWNKPLTRVSATVNLLGQSKRAPEQSIDAFGKAGPIEVYFDRTELPAGPVEGTVDLLYQELSPDPARQDAVEAHTFSVPMSVQIVVPPEPAEVKVERHIEPIHIMIAASVLLLIIVLVLAVLLLRKPKVA